MSTPIETPHELERRARIARARSTTARRLQGETARAAIQMFQLLLERGTMTPKERGVALALLDHALAGSTITPTQRRISTKYRDALDAGRRVGTITGPAEVHVGPFVSPLPRA